MLVLLVRLVHIYEVYIVGDIIEIKLNDIISNFHRIIKTGNSNSVVVPKEWAQVGDVVVVVIQDKNTIIVKKNIKIDEVGNVIVKNH